ASTARAVALYCNVECSLGLVTGSYSTGAATLTPRAQAGAPVTGQFKLRCGSSAEPPDDAAHWVGSDPQAPLIVATAIPAMTDEAAESAQAVHCILTNGQNPAGVYTGSLRAVAGV